MNFKKQNNCPICKKKISSKKNLVYFKQLPLTEILTKSLSVKKKVNFDQILKFCKKCNHLFLDKVYNPEKIYNNSYTNSSHSFSNIYAQNFFFNFIEKYINGAKKKIIEIGSNDLYLMSLFKKRLDKSIAIDPCVRKNKNLKNIKYIKKFISEVRKEEIDFTADMVLCSHTLEHIDNPVDFIKDLDKFGKNKTQFFFQFPSSESIINRKCFDQIHHQHLNYFSINSFQKVLEQNGYTVIDYSINEHHYGALMIYFEKNKKGIKKKNTNVSNIDSNFSLRESYLDFKKYLKNIENIVQNYKNQNIKIYAVGAGLMLQIINYHLDNLFSKIDGILDDDKSKVNKYFPNIKNKIMSLKNTNISNTVVIVAPVASSITTRKLISLVDKRNPKIIIVPTLSF